MIVISLSIILQHRSCQKWLGEIWKLVRNRAWTESPFKSKMVSVVSLHFLCTLNITLFAMIETGFSVNGFIAVHKYKNNSINHLCLREQIKKTSTIQQSSPCGMVCAKRKWERKRKRRKLIMRERAKEIKIIEVISKNVNVRSQNAKGGIRLR